MQIVMGIFIIASVLELRSLFRQKERKEAVIYLCMLAMSVVILVYLMLTPKFYSFSRFMNELFGVYSGGAK